MGWDGFPNGHFCQKICKLCMRRAQIRTFSKVLQISARAAHCDFWPIFPIPVFGLFLAYCWPQCLKILDVQLYKAFGNQIINENYVKKMREKATKQKTLLSLCV